MWKREVAAFHLSDHLDWHLVPPTVEREGPLGPGSLQLFVPHDMEQHYLTLREDPQHRQAFERLCVFDIVSNNTDRKSGHCLASEALQSVQTATTVRVRNGKVAVTDGPFAETKEQLAGFYMIDAKDLDEAIQIASRIPPARVGSIEVRPVRPIREAVAAKTLKPQMNADTRR